MLRLLEDRQTFIGRISTQKIELELTRDELYLVIIQLNLEVAADLLLSSNGSRGPVLAARVETKALDDSGQHDDYSDVVLPHHLPEKPDRIFSWSLKLIMCN